MFANTSPSQTYANIGVETGVMAANPHKLILMLYEGALQSVAVAKQAMLDGRTATKGEAISKAIEIIDNGLRASLDLEGGAEIAQRLAALYDYMCERLLHANLHDNPAALEEVRELLLELKGAWEEIAKDPAVVSDSRKLA
jgi:flagellar secretion chaperone FliS